METEETRREEALYFRVKGQYNKSRRIPYRRKMEMIEVEMLNVNGQSVQGLRVVAPGGEGHPNMLLIPCRKGYVMCGYLNLPAAESFGDAAAFVGGSCFEEIKPLNLVSNLEIRYVSVIFHLFPRHPCGASSCSDRRRAAAGKPLCGAVFLPSTAASKSRRRSRWR